MAKLETLQDDFNDGSFNLTKWQIDNAGLSYAETSSLRINLNVYFGSFTFSSKSSLGYYTLVDSYSSIKINTLPISGALEFALYAIDGSYLSISLSFGFIGFSTADYVNDIYYNSDIIAYNNEPYIGIVESGGIVYARISADGITWTTIGQTTYSSTFDGLRPTFNIISTDFPSGLYISLNDFNILSVPVPSTPANPSVKLRGKCKLRGKVKMR